MASFPPGWCAVFIISAPLLSSCVAAKVAKLEQSLAKVSATVAATVVGRDNIQTEGWATYLAVGALAIGMLSPFAILAYMVAHRFRSLRWLIDKFKGKSCE